MYQNMDNLTRQQLVLIREVMPKKPSSDHAEDIETLLGTVKTMLRKVPQELFEEVQFNVISLIRTYQTGRHKQLSLDPKTKPPSSQAVQTEKEKSQKKSVDISDDEEMNAFDDIGPPLTPLRDKSPTRESPPRKQRKEDQSDDPKKNDQGQSLSGKTGSAPTSVVTTTSSTPSASVVSTLQCQITTNTGLYHESPMARYPYAEHGKYNQVLQHYDGPRQQVHTLYQMGYYGGEHPTITASEPITLHCSDLPTINAQDMYQLQNCGPNLCGPKTDCIVRPQPQPVIKEKAPCWISVFPPSPYLDSLIINAAVPWCMLVS